MNLKLDQIDHVHVNVASWSEAEQWYQEVLGFKRVERLMPWAIKNGPLTIEDQTGKIHLALFESDAPENISAIAFGASAAQFMAWKEHLESHGLKLRLTDHTLAYSLYFRDPWRNLYEITTYERDAVAEQFEK
ncbi:MAG: VOC family protein [Gammaproteobacteria bacterium]|nr:VOC family protein [Gammaproteobacteria bacterium]MDH3768181.1 VOC family protein [Gammaproteobacteria bacterium]